MEYNNDHRPDAIIIRNFSINSYNLSYSKLSREKLQLHGQVPIFLREKYMPKIDTKETKPKQSQSHQKC